MNYVLTPTSGRKPVLSTLLKLQDGKQHKLDLGNISSALSYAKNTSRQRGTPLYNVKDLEIERKKGGGRELMESGSLQHSQWGWGMLGKLKSLESKDPYFFPLQDTNFFVLVLFFFFFFPFCFQKKAPGQSISTLAITIQATFYFF